MPAPSKVFININPQKLSELHFSIGFSSIINFSCISSSLLSYLTASIQQVCFADFRSNLALIRCVVPQGSILGTVLLYIDDITNSTDNLLFYLFANDATVFKTGDSDCQLSSFLTKELTHLCTCFRGNYLSLNTI